MDFNVAIWKESAGKKLQEIGRWVNRRRREDVPKLVYGALCGLSLWPLIEAAKAGQLLPVMLALGSVAGGVGGNLIAERVQRWKDLAAEAGQAEAMDWVAQNAGNPEVREALDAILEKLEAIPQAQAALGDADRQWFTETLRGELTRLGNLSRFEATLKGSGGIAQGAGAKAGGERSVVGETIEGVAVTGDKNIVAGGHVIITGQGATVVVGEPPVKMTAVDRASALGHYLQHVISRNHYLQLQGIRSGGRLVHIELDQIYITLRATRQQGVKAVCDRDGEEAWLAAEASLAPGEPRQLPERMGVTTETVTVSINEALAAYPRLAVLGDPGSGKTTLLRYLALLYARDLAESTTLVPEKLGLNESGRLPILLTLRHLGAFLQTRPEDGTEGHAVLLDFLFRSLANERITLPGDFFDDWLKKGESVILLDGLDEVADPDLRRRVSRLVEDFTRAYPQCRYVATSRIVGYTGPARLGEGYVTTTIRDFTMEDVEHFLIHWHRLVAIGQMGPGGSAEAYAADQTRRLMQAIEGNERIRELAINPLLLTVIAMVHRDRVKLPDRRAELYAEAIDVLLGKWEEAKGVQEVPILEGKTFDTGDKRLMLQGVALSMHEKAQKEVATEELRRWLGGMFQEIVGEKREADQAVDRFLRVIEERTGLLAARGEGVYAFSHLTFQEYLAAVAVAARDDYVEYTLRRVPEPWWREVILLEAGYLSMQSRERTTRLIQAIAGLKEERELYHNLVLAAECLRDAGSSRVQGDLAAEVPRLIRTELETPAPAKGLLGSFRVLLARGMTPKMLTERRIAAAQALARIGGKNYWTLPYGEPEWVQIPAGEFWMGSEHGDLDEQPLHKLYLDTFWIARVPITNAQYHLFIQATGHRPPASWEENRPTKGRESHPMVAVSWDDAIAYCQWLSQATGKAITLPSEAEWEKAARGDRDAREYPWGDSFDLTRCNSRELGLGDTTPVGIFPNGASPYGCLDMAGNVWEWTRSLWGGALAQDFRYPYDPKDGREDLESRRRRVVRGGAFDLSQWLVRCADRGWYDPDYLFRLYGFRLVVSPL